MGLKKHGVGQVLPDEQDLSKTAGSENWTDADEEELAEENIKE